MVVRRQEEHAGSDSQHGSGGDAGQERAASPRPGALRCRLALVSRRSGVFVLNAIVMRDCPQLPRKARAQRDVFGIDVGMGEDVGVHDDLLDAR
jgi:hypothetical protein